jgi:hypothetical protein
MVFTIAMHKDEIRKLQSMRYVYYVYLDWAEYTLPGHTLYAPEESTLSIKLRYAEMRSSIREMSPYIHLTQYVDVAVIPPLVPEGTVGTVSLITSSASGKSESTSNVSFRRMLLLGMPSYTTGFSVNASDIYVKYELTDTEIEMDRGIEYGYIALQRRIPLTAII